MIQEAAFEPLKIVLAELELHENFSVVDFNCAE